MPLFETAETETLHPFVGMAKVKENLNDSIIVVLFVNMVTFSALLLLCLYVICRYVICHSRIKIFFIFMFYLLSLTTIFFHLAYFVNYYFHLVSYKEGEDIRSGDFKLNIYAPQISAWCIVLQGLYIMAQ